LERDDRRDAWGPQDDAESVAAIERALDFGVNWIDTAAVYGFRHSEDAVRRALNGVERRPYVFTKAGVLDGGGGLVMTASSATRSAVGRRLPS